MELSSQDKSGTLKLIALLLGAICAYRWIRYIADARRAAQFARQHGCKPPTWVLDYKLPLALDVVRKGFAAGRQKKLLGLFTDYFTTMGPTVEVSILAGKGYASMDPENIEAVLSSQFSDFHLGPRNKAMKAMIGDGIFTQDGQAWKHSREILRHRFARMQYQNLNGFRYHVEHLLSKIEDIQGVVDLQPLFYNLTLDTTIAMILGQPVESFRYETGVKFGKAFDRASLITATRVRLGDLYFLFAPKGFFQACKTVKELTQRFVKDALQGDGTENVRDTDTFIDDLNKAYQDDALVRDQVINVLIAGRDTTASTLSYAFRLLVSHPQTMSKLREEVSNVIGVDGEVSRSSIQRMPYLQNVIKETLRLFPPVPINTRFCQQMTTLPRGGGKDGQSPLLIREGMPVAYSVYHMQRRTDIYGSDALAFRPERWEGDKLGDNKWAYLPFNGGPRVCLGKDFALMLASYCVTRLLQTFSKIELPPGVEIEPIGEERQHLTLTMSNADGCKVLIQR